MVMSQLEIRMSVRTQHRCSESEFPRCVCLCVSALEPRSTKWQPPEKSGESPKSVKLWCRVALGPELSLEPCACSAAGPNVRRQTNCCPLLTLELGTASNTGSMNKIFFHAWDANFKGNVCLMSDEFYSQYHTLVNRTLAGPICY